MSLFNKNGNGMMDVIRCDQKEYLLWKWHPGNALEGNNIRENFIRWGSSLRVKDGEIAVFVYSNKEESTQEYIVGPTDCILDTENLPIISNIVGLAYGGGTPFPAEVYFINLAQIIQQKIIVPYFDVFDTRFTDFSVPVAVRGTISFKITDYERFIKLHRLITFSLEDFNKQVKDAVSRYVKNVVANAPIDFNIPVIQLERKIDEITSLIENDIKLRFYEEFGVTVSNVDIAAIDVDKASEGYKELKKITKDLATDSAKAENEIKIKDMQAQQKIGVFEKVANKFVDIKENQFIRHKQSQREYSDVIEDSRAGKIGAIIGKVIRSVQSANAKDAPPEIPSFKKYFIAIDGEAKGPYDIESLKAMINNNELSKDSLVWTKNMKDWVEAGKVKELEKLFSEQL